MLDELDQPVVPDGVDDLADVRFEDAVLVCQGRRKGLRIKVLDDQPTLFDEPS
jgi:hypothetical protein